MDAGLGFGQTFDFQDAIGESLLEIMRVTPGGVLCFFPSYKLLTKVGCPFLCDVADAILQCRVG